MTTIAAMLGLLVALAFLAKDYSWRVKGIILAGLIVMVVLLMR